MKQIRRRWTRQEIAILRKMYRSKPNAEIGKKIGRTMAQVAVKAHSLGLYKGTRRLREMGRENIARRWK